MGASITIKPGTGIASFTYAWVNTSGNRTPSEGYTTCLSSTSLANCDHVYIYEVSVKSGYGSPYKVYMGSTELTSKSSQTISYTYYPTSSGTLQVTATATSPSIEYITANLKCGDGVSYYQVYNNTYGEEYTISSTSYQSISLVKGRSYNLSAPVFKSGYSGVKWWYNSSSSYSYPNTSTTSPDYTLGTSYNRYGYFEATTYTPPTDYFTATATKGTGISSATVNNYGSVYVESGTSVTYRATASSGYTFSGWYRNGSRVSTSSTYTVTITSDFTLEARATQTSFTATASKGTGISSATVNNKSSVTVDSGTSVTFRCSVSSGYVWDGWYLNNSRVSTSQTYTVSVTSDITLQARATAIVYYTATATKGTGISSATVNYSSSVTVEEGTSVTFRASVSSGYVWQGWYLNNTRVSTSQNYTITVDSDIELEARARRTSYTCTAVAGNGIDSATVNYYTSTTVEEGGSATFRCTVSTGYSFSGWYLNGYRVSTSKTYTVTVDSDIELEARASINYYTCEAYAGNGVTSATVNGYSSVGVNYGGTAQFRCTLASNATWLGWYNADDELVSSTRNYDVTVTKDTYLTARASVPTYTCTASAGTGISAATVNGSSSAQIVSGGLGQWRCTVMNDYTWDGWYEDDMKLSSTQDLDITIHTARALQARATRTPHTASAYSTGYGCCFSSVSASPSSFTSGTTVTFTASLNTGYTFRGWYDSNGNRVSTSRTYTVTGGSSNITYYARADFDWTYAKSSGSSAISAEEFRRLQTYITQRNQAVFDTQPNVGDAMTRDYYNMVKNKIGTGTTVVRFQAISAALLNALKNNANNL